MWTLLWLISNSVALTSVVVTNGGLLVQTVQFQKFFIGGLAGEFLDFVGSSLEFLTRKADSAFHKRGKERKGEGTPCPLTLVLVNLQQKAFWIKLLNKKESRNRCAPPFILTVGWWHKLGASLGQLNFLLGGRKFFKEGREKRVLPTVTHVVVTCAFLCSKQF